MKLEANRYTDKEIRVSLKPETAAESYYLDRFRLAVKEAGGWVEVTHSFEGEGSWVVLSCRNADD